MVVGDNSNLVHSLRTGTFVATQDLQVALTGIAEVRLPGRYYKRAKQQGFIKRLQLEISSGW